MNNEVLTFEVEIELFVELEGSVVVLPVIAEEFQEPLLGELVATVVVFFLVT